MWTSLTRTAGPTGEVLALEEAKAHLRLLAEETDQDDLLAALIEAAVSLLDGPQGLGVALLTQSWRATLPGWPCAGAFRLPLGPVQSLAAITYLDPAGATQTLDPTLYVLDAAQRPAIVQPAYGKAWPATLPQSNAVRIDFTAGYGDTAAAVPAPIRAALKLIVGDLYANREAVVIDARAAVVESPTVERLLAPYRVRF